jgi:septal ring-binding cell division protein DamX
MIAVRRTEAVKAFITRHPELGPFAVFRQGVSEAPLWVVLQGDYATERQAREVRSRFPAGIQPHEKLRIRPFGQVQSELGPGQQ